MVKFNKQRGVTILLQKERQGHPTPMHTPNPTSYINIIKYMNSDSHHWRMPLVQFYHQMDISEPFLGTVKCIFWGLSKDVILVKYKKKLGSMTFTN